MQLLQILNSVALSLLLISGSVSGQDDANDATLEQMRSGVLIRDLQTQVKAQPSLTGDKHELAIFYHKRGRAHVQLGNNLQAVEDLRLALANNQPTRATFDNWGDRWRIQDDLDHALTAIGDHIARIEYISELAREYRDLPFTYHVVNLKLATAHVSLGNFLEAVRALAEAELTLSRMRREPRWQRNGDNSLGLQYRYHAMVLRQQGNYTEAERLLRLSLSHAQRNVELQKRLLGQYHQFTRVGVANLAASKIDLANVLATRGLFGEAEFYARSGLEDRLGMYHFETTAVSQALAMSGWARFQQREIASAEQYYRHALTALNPASVASYSGNFALRRADLANTRIVRGQWREALVIFEQRDQGLRSNPEQFKRTGSNHIGWAYALHKTGESKRAAQMAGGMASNYAKREVLDRWYLAQLRGVHAMALAAIGSTQQALDSYRLSVPDLIRRDSDDGAEENTGYWRAFWQRVILEGYLELLAGLHAKGVAVDNLDLVDESFRIADIARGSQVQEAISATAVRAQLPDANLSELARKEHDAANRIIALNKVLSYLAGTREHEQRAKLMTDVTNDIARLRKERAQLRADITKRYPEYAELTDPRPVGIAEVRKALSPNEAMISIYVGENQSYVWTLDAGDKTAFRVIPVKREDIERDIDRLRDAVDFGDGNPNRMRAFDLTRAYQLYRAYLEPDQALWQDARVLNIIPHGPLSQIPLSLLVTEAPKSQPGIGAQTSYAEAPWLIRKVAIAQLPSDSAFTALRRTPVTQAKREAFIGFGDPIFSNEANSNTNGFRNLAVRKIADPMDQQLTALAQGKTTTTPTATPTVRNLSQAFGQLSPLPDTADELREIAQVLKADPNRDLYLNKRATERNVKQTRLDNTRVLAFATHGIAPGELTGLDQPALVLSNPALTGDIGNDGFLTMEEVLGLKLNADWVILSACNTASSDGRGSEAVSGLGRAFFYAGAKSLLVSNWAVETTSAKLLTTEIFRKQAENPNLTRAEALRQAMLTVMAQKAPGGYSYAHPAFWAPFSLVGDGGR